MRTICVLVAILVRVLQRRRIYHYPQGETR